MLTDIPTIFSRHIQLMTLVSEQLSAIIDESATVIAEALRQGNKILIMGNGGSAADSQHFVAELSRQLIIPG